MTYTRIGIMFCSDHFVNYKDRKVDNLHYVNKNNI